MTNQTSNSTDYQLPADWRGQIITAIRQVMKQADPEIVEEVKWKTASNPGGVLAWYCEGLITTGEIYKKHLRLGFAKGVALKEHDPTGLINAYRAVLIKEEDGFDERAFRQLVIKAVELNRQAKRQKVTQKK